jgi:hypothetical protein
MLAAAIVLGFLSFLSDIERVHFGPGPIPVWLPLAIDAAIAGAAGAVLTIGSGLFDPPAPRTASEYVLVAKPVWEKVQAEIVAGRSAKDAAGAQAFPPAPAPTPPPASPVVPTLNPWDEGPPIGESGGTPGEPGTTHAKTPSPPARTAASLDRPPASSPPSPGSNMPLAALPLSISRGPAPSMSGRTASPRPPHPAATASPNPADLSAAELEEIARMGGILGVVPLKGETGPEYARRLKLAREALSGPI